MILDMIPLAIFDASSFFQWFVENANYLFVFVFMTMRVLMSVIMRTTIIMLRFMFISIQIHIFT